MQRPQNGRDPFGTDPPSCRWPRTAQAAPIIQRACLCDAPTFGGSITASPHVTTPDGRRWTDSEKSATTGRVVQGLDGFRDAAASGTSGSTAQRRSRNSSGRAQGVSAPAQRMAMANLRVSSLCSARAADGRQACPDDRHGRPVAGHPEARHGQELPEKRKTRRRCSTSGAGKGSFHRLSTAPTSGDRVSDRRGVNPKSVSGPALAGRH